MFLKKDVLRIEILLNVYCIDFLFLVIIFKFGNEISFINLFEKYSIMVV